MADVFVSYSRRDAEFVGRLAEDLRQRGKEVWVDVEGIRDAEVFPQALRRAIEGSDAFLFVISPDSVSSEYCEQEVGHAAELNKRIVPIALCPVPDDEIPSEIRDRNWISVHQDGNFEAGVERVLDALETDLGWERQHTRLTVKAVEWDESGRDASFLLRGSDLAAADRWLAAGADKDPGPTVLEQEYLLVARQAVSRRQRQLVGGSLSVAVVAIGLLIFALISRGQAVSAETTAKSQALAAESEVQQSVDPERGVLLAIAAVRKQVSYGPSGTMFALRAAIDASMIRYRLPPEPVQGCGGPGVVYDPAPRSNVLVEGLCGGLIKFAAATSGRIERTVRLPGSVASLLLYTENGSALVTAAGPRLLVLDPVTGAVRARSPLVPGLSTFAIDPRAPIVAAIGHQRLDLWDMATRRLTVVRPKQAYPQATSIVYSPDGRQLAITFDSYGTSFPGLIVYDVTSGRIVRSAPTPASTAAYSPSGRELAVGEQVSVGGAIVMLNARTLKPEPGFVAVQVADVEPIVVGFSPDGSQLAYGFADGTAGLVSVATGQPIDSYLGNKAAVTAVSFTPDGRLVATGSADGTVRVWHAGGLAEPSVHVGSVLADVESEPGGFASLANPGAGPHDGVVAQLWLDDGQPAGPSLVLSPASAVGATFLGAGGRLAAVIPAPAPTASRGVVRVWSLPERRVVRTVSLSLPSGDEPRISPDGNLIAMNVQAASSSPTPPSDLDVLDLRTGRQRVLATETPCGEGWRGFAFSPSSRLLAAGTFCGGDVSIWNLAAGKRVGGDLGLDGGELSWIAFSPDAGHIAVASWNGTIKVTPVPITGHGIETLTQNTKGAPMVAYSPNGRYLASAGLDHTVRIFDAHTLTELRVIAQPDADYGVAFTDDSQHVLSWGADNSVRLWDACTDCENPRALLALAGTRVTRPLTAQERAEFGVN
jgi:WD40 repeat protein